MQYLTEYGPGQDIYAYCNILRVNRLCYQITCSRDLDDVQSGQELNRLEDKLVMLSYRLEEEMKRNEPRMIDSHERSACSKTFSEECLMIKFKLWKMASVSSMQKAFTEANTQIIQSQSAVIRDFIWLSSSVNGKQK